MDQENIITALSFCVRVNNPSICIILPFEDAWHRRGRMAGLWKSKE